MNAQLHVKILCTSKLQLRCIISQIQVTRFQWKCLLHETFFMVDTSYFILISLIPLYCRTSITCSMTQFQYFQTKNLLHTCLILADAPAGKSLLLSPPHKDGSPTPPLTQTRASSHLPYSRNTAAGSRLYRLSPTPTLASLRYQRDSDKHVTGCSSQERTRSWENWTK